MSDGEATGSAGAGASPKGPQSTNLAAVAGGVILIGLVAFGLYRMKEAQAPADPVAAGEPEAASQGLPGAVADAGAIQLSPKASVAAERYRCVCGCNDPLSVCTCRQTPGSVDMKQHLQELVDQGMTAGEVDDGMIEKYGESVLLSNPPASESSGSGP